MKKFEMGKEIEKLRAERRQAESIINHVVEKLIEHGGEVHGDVFEPGELAWAVGHSLEQARAAAAEAEAQRLTNEPSTTPTTRTVKLTYPFPLAVGTRITVGPTDPADDPSEVGVVLAMDGDGTEVTFSTDPAVIAAMSELYERARALEARVGELVEAYSTLETELAPIRDVWKAADQSSAILEAQVAEVRRYFVEEVA